ncbi:MAG: nucleotidyltransferase domain-containing protein, partial [Candidatus Zixiibacteriota bacterium]
WTLKEKMEADFGIKPALTDIDNSAALLELSTKSLDTWPECPFNPYLFHDLINADIQYLILKEHDDGCMLNIRFLRGSTNIITEILTKSNQVDNIIKLIDIRKETHGQIMRISMNAKLNEALGYLTKVEPDSDKIFDSEEVLKPQKEDYWRWRLKMVERIASKLDAERFGVKNFYIFGSTKNASAGPCSDIDLLIHHDSTPEQLHQLKLWLEGWSLCLDEMNYLRTGFQSDGLLDVQFITDEDISQKTSFAAMIDAITDRARQIPLKGNESLD